MRPSNQHKADSAGSRSSCSPSTRSAPARLSRLTLAFTTAVLLSATAVQAQSWVTVDDAAGETGERVYQVTSDSAGNTFAAGSMVDATGRGHAVIMKSSDTGATWSTVADYPAVYTISVPGAPENPIGASFHTIASAPVAGGENHLVAAGVYRRGLRPGTTSPYAPQWVIIRSKDGGATWETLDEYVHPTDTVLTPRDVAVDANGNVYVVGMVPVYTGLEFKSPYICHWLIRKGVVTPRGGMTWSTVGDFSHGDGSDSTHVFDADGPSGVACVGTNVYVVGGGTNSWVVRKSSNGGSTWQVVDTYQYGKNLKSHAYDVAADSAGNIYVTGFGQKLGTRWIVRRLPSGGTKWSTVDDFRLSGGSYAEGNEITIDANNNVHVTGMATYSPGKWNWVTRQRSAATGTWSTTDLFSLAATQDTVGRSITTDSAGNLFSAGYGDDSAGIRHGWIVRRKPAP